MRFVFRTDASSEIGTGHVMRCLSLADALRKMGAQCLFVSREHQGNLISLIRQRNFPVIGLPKEDAEILYQYKEDTPIHSSWLGAHWSDDARATIAAIGEVPADWLVVDHYALDSCWERIVRPHCKRLMIIDDLADRTHDCDILLNQNLGARKSCYENKIPSASSLLLGPKFAILQSEYQELHSQVKLRKGSVCRIFAYFGGGDSEALTTASIEAFLSLGRKDVILDLVHSENERQKKTINTLIQGHHNIIAHSRLRSLAPLMLKADAALGAAGTTTWERCCLGLPSLVITIAENQIPAAAELHRQGLIRWLGHKSEVDSGTLRQELQKLLDDGITDTWSKKCHELVDGQGSNRIIEELWRKIQ